MEDSKTITFGDFAKVDIRVGKVVEAREVEGSEKLIRLRVDFGVLGERIIFAGIKKWYKTEDLVDKLFVFVFNLEPRSMFGEESQGMIVAAETDTGDECVLLVPDKDITPGTKVH